MIFNALPRYLEKPRKHFKNTFASKRSSNIGIFLLKIASMKRIWQVGRAPRESFSLNFIQFSPFERKGIRVKNS